ncbi:hypothetical protein [Pseudoalteromonas sp. McH1-42]|uniref:DUF6966 domain-containing protein n=1 Tax=Pseudoalteromonas sp. McH1-42 TaxID=2917752 RepID=UPI001EF4B77E|nr:hypothetical protein [Pseudoalteromonas sp. McH1-42]MCG7563120.1 hypothetical protein [Pseudoalteromonas sp. McH1-42]
MGPKTKELVAVLDEMISYLKDDGNENWLIWMQEARKRIIQSDFSGVEKVLGAYGGMGSFNDYYLSRTTRKNERFSSLQSKAWSLATEIKHEYQTRT